VPAQTYAVVKHRGPIALLPQTLAWFIFDWLPQSNYRGVDGFELERYPDGYDGTALNAEMEYWLPVEIA
ncbi:GyrI-like domain-containing protein, partial [Vibrio vulnificus]